MGRKLKQACGNWVVGDRFWDREDDIRLLIKKIDEGAHISLVAQRRMGKTSLMKELKRQLNDRYICLFIDLQKASTSADAIVELSLALKPIDSLWGKTTKLFSNAMNSMVEGVEELNLGEVGIKLRGGLHSGNWREKGDSLFSILAKSGHPVLLMIDEVPLMVNRMLKGEDFKITYERKVQVDEFMSWLRKNSIEYQGIIRIMLSGSIGFEPVLRQAGLSAVINNFQPYDLKPWDNDIARGCLQALANEYGLEFINNADDVMVQKLGCCIPNHVQMFFTHVYDRCTRRNNLKIYPEEVDEIYDSEMLGIRGHAELTHYEERLKLVLSPEVFPLALEILTETAVTGSLTTPVLKAFQKEYSSRSANISEDILEILRVLEHDGYIRKAKEDYVYESKLLKDWWKKRYADLYEPIMQRRG